MRCKHPKPKTNTQQSKAVKPWPGKNKTSNVDLEETFCMCLFCLTTQNIYSLLGKNAEVASLSSFCCSVLE